MKYSDFTAVILCAGKGSRAKTGDNKMFFTLSNGKTVLDTVLSAFDEFENIILVHSKDDEPKLKDYGYIKVLGGNTRGESAKNALEKVKTPYVLIHDGARPYVSKTVIERCIEQTRKTGCAIACVKEINSLKKQTECGAISVCRDEYFEVQTPQAFDSEKLKLAYAKVGLSCSDDSEVYEKAGYPIHLCEGDYANKKLTNPADFAPDNFRIGYGFDVHALVKSRPLMLGGIKIEHYLGLLGHSDADALVHAIMDALLSACGKKDIGCLFPDTDPKFEGVDSCKLLEQVMDEIQPYKVINLSAVIMAQKPKMAPHIPLMRKRLASILNVDIDCVNISATTTEKLGIVGEEKGIACSATVLVSKNC